MNNLNTSFDSFVNEEIIPEPVKKWASKTFKPGEMGDIVKKIFADIKYNFDVEKLEKENTGKDRTYNTYFFYTTSLGDKIKVDKYGRFYINDDNVTEFVNLNISRDIFNFFQNQYITRDHVIFKKRQSDRKSTLRDKYSKYLHTNDEEYGTGE